MSDQLMTDLENAIRMLNLFLEIEQNGLTTIGDLDDGN